MQTNGTRSEGGILRLIKEGEPTTTRLELRLLGQPQVHLDGVAVTGFRTAKVEALLYYLAVTGRAHGRESLVTLLWGDMPEAAAKRNLTQVLSLLRKQFALFLEITPQQIGLKPEATYWVDVHLFQQTLETINPAQEPERLRQVIELYQGDFLQGFYVKEALDFEAWVLTQRERLRELMIRALDSLVNHYLGQANYSAGLDIAARLLALEPWRETAHRQMMLLLARGGRREAALAQYETCRQVLAKELGVEPMAETTALFERLKASGAPLPHNLPPPTSFVGRERELSHLRTQLGQADCRLLTLTGPGGIGKTRLAIEVARRCLEPILGPDEVNFADGVYFVNLAPVSAGETISDGLSEAKQATNLILITIAAALDFFFQGAADLKTQVFGHLRRKEMLLVLDNFEQLIEGAGLLVELLEAAPGLRLLVTSRGRLNLPAEWVWEVSGLDYPQGDWTAHINAGVGIGDARHSSIPPGYNVSNLQAYDAVALFCLQAQRVRGDFSLSESEAPYVLRLCQLVEGVPLALELAASWLRALTCAEVVAEAERSLDFLSSSLRHVLERHRSLRAVFNHSWHMLSLQEREVFGKLSIFRGGFTRQAAARVANASLATLAALVDKSFIRLTTAGRYTMHEMLRQYGVEKLWTEAADFEAGEVHGVSRAETVWERYSRYYLGLVSQHETDLHGSEPHQAIAELRAELDNIRQSWRWAVLNADLAGIEGGLEALADFYELIGLFQEAEELFGGAVSMLGHKGSDLRCHLLIKQARFANLQGNYKAARLTVENALHQAEQSHHPLRLAEARQLLGQILIYLGELDQAIDTLELAVTDFQALTQPRQLAFALSSLGDAYSRKLLATEALNCLEQALQLNKQLDNKRAQAFISGMIGNVYIYTEKYETALAYHQNVLARYQELDYAWGVGATLLNIGLLYYYLERYQEALTVSHEALQIFRRLGDVSSESMTLENLGTIYTAQGQYPQAQHCLEQALSLSLEIGTKLGESYVSYRLGQLCVEKGDYEQSLAYLHQAAELGEVVGDPKHTALCRGELAIVYHRLKDFDQALAYYHQAITALQSLKMQFDTAHFMVQQATLLFEQKQLDQAQALAAAGVRLAQEIARPQTIFDGQLLQAKITFAGGQEVLARQQLQALFSIAGNESQQAALHYELWKMNQGPEHARLALIYYRQLVTQTTNILYRERLNELQSLEVEEL
jgi:DNA-binding SARP family transcriptional activator/predicted ATPase